MCFLDLCAQDSPAGTIMGTVVDQSTRRPVEFANVVLRQTGDSAIVTGVSTDKSGKFRFTPVPSGNYFITFRLIGYKERSTPVYPIDGQRRLLDLGEIRLVPTTVSMEGIMVTAEKPIFSNAFDRKVYNIDQDMMSKAGSVSDLLQNVPSVVVDIDGNVSLRGSSNVTIMIDGRSSALMEKNSATVLQQMPASTIEKIEVMTNPSAKYKPDGTSGIINIVTKKNTTLGVNGDIGGNAGNQDRYNANLRLNFNPGRLNLYGGYGIRKDSRNRITTDFRRQVDSVSAVSFYDRNVLSTATPVSHTVSLGCDNRFDEGNQAGISGNFFYNGVIRTETSGQSLRNTGNAVLNQYERRQLGEEYENEYGFTTYVEHQFPKRDHKLRLEFDLSRSRERENNRYANVYSVPAGVNAYDNSLFVSGDNRNRLTLEYANPLNEQSSLEAGYYGEFTRNDFDIRFENFDENRNQFVADVAKTNRFLYDESINAMYATYQRSFGSFGFEGGVRMERASVTSNLVTLDSTIDNSYFNVYPALHLSYKLNPLSELRLSYSRRTHRPHDEDLNPFPEYRDPRNITAGNPKLLPEYIHSIEFGCQFQNDQISFFPALYYRSTYNRFTSLTRSINDTLLLTTRDNLSNDRSGGLELVLSADLGEFLTAHWSGNAFVEQIDAANLGYNDRKSITTWSSAVTVSVHLGGASRMQVNANYNSSRLTPQGQYSPSYVVNTGFRQEFMDGKLSLILTIADIFKSMKRELALDTPLLNQAVVNMRDTRIFYLGFAYHFGSPPKKSEEEQIRYDDNL